MSLTIVIPCMNEEKYIGTLLDQLASQIGIQSIPIIIADGGSQDSTLDIINQKKDNYSYLNIEVIEGGNPNKGRNAGLQKVSTDLVVFLDSDIQFWSGDTLYQGVQKLEEGWELVTCKLKGYGKSTSFRFWVMVWNWVHRILAKRYPFAIGGFFMTKTVRFRNLGGFDERVDNSGDFLASQWYSPESFFILDRYIGQDNRRVKKIGYRRMIVHLIKNFWMYRKMGKSWFYKKSGYWG